MKYKNVKRFNIMYIIFQITNYTIFPYIKKFNYQFYKKYLKNRLK
ncbi:MAG: hypothetical protein ACRYE7_00905 [Janthinobacterium lividum]